MKISKDQMKSRVIAWAKKFNDDPLYRIEDISREDSIPAFRFLYDGEAWERIEYYRSDGMHREAGEAFEALTDDTDWFYESEQPGIEYFVRLR